MRKLVRMRNRNLKSLFVSTLAATIATSAPVGVLAVESYQDNSHEGFASTLEGFNQAFTGDLNTRMQPRVTIPTSIYLDNVSINGDELSLNLNLITGTNPSVLSIEGRLYAGTRTSNSIILIPNNVTEGYEILLFEIHNEHYFGSLLLPSSEETYLAYRPHVKIYMKSPSGLINLFELELPSYFENLSSSNFSELDNKDYFLWFQGIVDIQVQEKYSTDELMQELGLVDYTSLIQPLGLNTFTTWGYPTTFFSSISVGGETFEISARPQVHHSRANVTGQNSTWTAEFGILENTRVLNNAGSVVRQHTGQGFFRFRNVGLAFGVGANTTILQTQRQGRFLGSSNLLVSSGNIALNVLRSTAVSALPIGSLLQNTINHTVTAFQNASSSTVSLGGTASNLAGNIMIAAGYQLPGTTTLHLNRSTANGHYFLLHATVRRQGNVSGTVNTAGSLRTSFSVYTNSGTTPYPSHNNLRTVNILGLGYNVSQ